jgi:hypothetical protein
MRDDDGGSGTGKVTATIRTGSHSGTVVYTLTLNLNKQTDFRYYFAVDTFNSGGPNSCTGYTQHNLLGQ